MKLLYDLVASQPNFTGKVHGGGRYAAAVFFELASRDVDMECVYDSGRPLREDIRETIESRGIKLHDRALCPLEEIARNGNFTTFYSADAIFDTVMPSGLRVILTLHGLRELEMPRDWMLLRYRTGAYHTLRTIFTFVFHKWWKSVLRRRALTRLTRPGIEFIAVSNHTKYSCLSYMPEMAPGSIEVFYSPSTGAPRQGLKPYAPGYRYVLLVSGNRGEKNAMRALKALDEIFSERKDLDNLHVVVTGATGSSFRYKPANPGRMHFVGYVDDDTLESMYMGAELFLYPSFNEGFGYPPLEAMKYGVPVAASSLTSIPEVCGDAAMYFNPFDCKEIKGRILRILYSGEERRELSQKGKERYAMITSRQHRDLSRLADYICR